LADGELFGAAPERDDPERESRNRVREAAHAAGIDSSGHRARLRKRLLEGGAEALADHEIVEYLLMTAIPRRDTKPLARSLLNRFGGLAGVFNAEPRALAGHPGMGETSAAAIRIVALAARRFARTEMSEQPILASWQALLDYLQIDMAHLPLRSNRCMDPTYSG